ncbi:MAG: NirD/YgiW/YdeI family stress tolerance protein [Alphaproteobacteria bacterium]|nr:NirD/YgiW/YdeI family stress tolerance protein [Alphaproteobacteria bacterium]
MKKLVAISVLSLGLGLSAQAWAQNVGGGYTGPGIPSITVQEALKLSDDTPVVLVGKIEKSLGNEKYVFTDESGKITIEIDDEDWKGLTVGADDVVEIRGEVDKDFTSIEIDVDSVVKK